MLTVGSLDSYRRVPLFQVHSHAVYTAGHLLFLRDRRRLAQPFDAGKLKATGEAAIVAEDVELNDRASLRGAFTASDTGVLAYRTLGQTRLAWFDRAGRLEPMLGDAGRYRNPALSPDERRIAVERADPRIGQSDIWIVDVESGIPSRFTDGGAEKPLWDLDNHRLIFRVRQARGSLISRPTRGDAPDTTVLIDTPPSTVPSRLLAAGAVSFTPLPMAHRHRRTSGLSRSLDRRPW